jgi:hypothetical protein
MNAYEIPNLRFSLPAGEDVARRRFVSVNSSSEGVIATAAGSAIGVSMNQAADGEVLDIADGIVIVEAGGAIAAGADVEVGANGKAVAKTTGIGVGVAITGATDAGQLVAVKLLSVSNANGADGADGVDGADAPLVQTFVYTAADLDAGADITDAIIGIVPAGYDATVTDAQVISTGAASGIEAEATSVVLLEVGSTKIAEVTFDADKAFPAAGAAEAITLVPEAAELDAGSVLLLTVTNGEAVNLPVFMVQITLTLTPAA